VKLLINKHYDDYDDDDEGRINYKLCVLMYKAHSGISTAYIIGGVSCAGPHT